MTRRVMDVTEHCRRAEGDVLAACTCGMCGWEPWRAGDTAFVVVTDHPAFAVPTRVGDANVCRTRDEAERLAAVWNDYAPTALYPFHVEERVLLAPLRFDNDGEAQATLW